MSLFTSTIPYAGLVDVHSNSGWHIKISRKRQIFICHTAGQAPIELLRGSPQLYGFWIIN